MSKETKIIGLSIKEWGFVLSLFGLTGNQLVTNITGNEELTHKVDDTTLRVEIDSLKAQMSRTFNQEAMDAIVEKEIAEVTGRDIEFIREALNGVEDSNKGQSLFDSIYKPYLDRQMTVWNGVCGLSRTRKNIEGKKIREYNACGIGWVQCTFSHPPGRDNIEGDWWWYMNPITNSVVVLDDMPRIPLI